MVAKITAVLKLIRVRQWVKTCLFLLRWCSLCSSLMQHPACKRLLPFCLLPGIRSLYAMNDIIDLERDKHHPRKKNRPLPAGILTIPESAVIGALCLGFGFFMAFLLDITVAVILFIYLLMNVYYSLWGKNIIVFDTMLIAIGFVLRVLAGAYAIAVRPSSWMLVATFFLALLLGLGKRYNELRVLEGIRPITARYWKNTANLS